MLSSRRRPVEKIAQLEQQPLPSIVFLPFPTANLMTKTFLRLVTTATMTDFLNDGLKRLLKSSQS